MSNSLKLPSHFIAPRYGGGCFADLPGFVRSLFLPDAASHLAPNGFAAMPQQPRNVILILVDAFGWSFFERYADHPFLRRFVDNGSVTKLTAQFPSTTAAHITTLYTGLPVGRHGVFEWRIYEPLVDNMIQPLLFSWNGDKQPETLRPTGLRAEQVVPPDSLAQQLGAAGIPTTVFQHTSYARSSYSNAITRGANSIAYKTEPEALATLHTLLRRPTLPPLRGEPEGGEAPFTHPASPTPEPEGGETPFTHPASLTPEPEGGETPFTHPASPTPEPEGRRFYLLYFGDVDTVCHDHGPNSPQLEAQALAYLDSLERWMLGMLAEKRGDTLLLVTADHGQTFTDPSTTLYLNQAPAFDRVQPLLRTNRQGQLLMPGGSCRDLFVYARDEAVDEMQSRLQRIVQDRAVVCRVADLVEAGYFGPLPASKAFLSRVGNLVILPFAGEGVWWYEKDRFEQTYYGHHGGLTAEEMEIPLLLYSFD